MRIARDCAEVCRVIESCETLEQFDTAVEMAHRFADKYDIRADKNEHLTMYADDVNGHIDDKEEELECANQNALIGFLR
jgi:hypothetical protein